MAGHSKWANIKHKKGREDARRGKLFSKLSRMITVAAREGGGDPDMNSDLRLAIQKAKDQNMPNDNIERAIKRGTGEISGVNYERFIYEGYGPGGVALYMEMMSDNRNRTASEIRHILSKHGEIWVNRLCLLDVSAQGQLVVDLDESEFDEDTLMLMAIDAGADDVVREDNLVNIYTEPASLEEVRESLEGEGVKFVSADLAMIAENTIELDADTARKTLKLMDVLEDHDDVQEVYSNFDIPEEIMAEIAEEV